LRQRQAECSLPEALHVSAADVPQEETESVQLVQFRSRRFLVTITSYIPIGDDITRYH
jgi:hypothetical protein